MSKGSLKKNWRKLDNVAKIFSLDSKKNTNTFRYSVILKESIDEKILKVALNKALNNYREFKVKIKNGLFWSYLELNTKESIVEKENQIPCEHIDLKKNNDYLFKVTYYKNKINLDVFHVLTDGTGALEFFKSIVYNYLSLKYNIKFNENKNTNDINYQDQYLKNYNKKLKTSNKYKQAYQIPGKINKKINNTSHYIINIEEIKKVCKKYNVTITEYLTAIYIYAIYLSFCNKKTTKEIIIEVPINLRKHYNVETLSNFFVCMKISPKILKNNLTTFDKVLNQVHNEFQKKLNEDKIKSYLARDVNLGTNISIRLVPLFIKKIFMQSLGTLITKISTSTLSNIGIIEIEEKYKKYIDNFFVLVMPGKVQKIKCTVCSFDKNLNVTINSNIDNIELEKNFFKLLKKELKDLKIESNINLRIGEEYVSKNRNKKNKI